MSKNDQSLSSPAAVPFVKWAGGKRQLLPEILKRIPSDVFSARAPAQYFEPFVGGGALFFALFGSNAFSALDTRPIAILSDINERLVRAYIGVRDHVEEVIALLGTYENTLKCYLAARDCTKIDHLAPIDSDSDAERAAWFIYVNRTCFNGLYRVNKKNEFNVPFGHYKSPTICNPKALRACSYALQGVHIRRGDFGFSPLTARRGDFVYYDPPYLPISPTSNFTAYDQNGFTVKDHVSLRNEALALKRQGVHVLLTQSSAPLVYELYKDEFTITEVDARRCINSDGAKRGAVKELIIT